jgi:hypothetical protein
MSFVVLLCVVCLLNVVVSQSTTSTDYDGQKCSTDQYDQQLTSRLDALQQVLIYIIEQQQQQQQIIDKLLGKRQAAQ